MASTEVTVRVAYEVLQHPVALTKLELETLIPTRQEKLRKNAQNAQKMFACAAQLCYNTTCCAIRAVLRLCCSRERLGREEDKEQWILLK